MADFEMMEGEGAVARQRLTDAKEHSPRVGSLPLSGLAQVGLILQSILPGKQRRQLAAQIGQHYGNHNLQAVLGNLKRSGASGRAGGPLEPEFQDRLQQLRSAGGQPLPDHILRQAQRSTGYRLAAVRIHTGSAAAQIARQFGAKAFTTGRDIFYGENQSPSDMGLTMHEITHTIQQGMSDKPPRSIGAADTHHEHAAHGAADRFLTGSTGRAAHSRLEEQAEVRLMRDPAVQREVSDEEDVQREVAEDDEKVQREPNDEEEKGAVMMLRDPSVQREADEDDVQRAASADEDVQREPEEEVMMLRDPSVQREADEDDIQREVADEETEGVQREPEEEVMMLRDPAVQREAQEDEDVQREVADEEATGAVMMLRDPAVQREVEEDEGVQREPEEKVMMLRDPVIQRMAGDDDCHCAK